VHQPKKTRFVPSLSLRKITI